MRTALDIDDDVLAAAEELAFGQNTTAGKVISDFARKALAAPISDKATWRNGLPCAAEAGRHSHNRTRKSVGRSG
jgi:hypothetical protein